MGLKKLLIITLIFFPLLLSAAPNMGHLGLGYSNQLVNDIPAFSLKYQSSPTTSFGGLFNFSTAENSGGWGVGAKFYRNIFSEPNLLFYGAFLLGFASRDLPSGIDASGLQGDLTIGSEFFIPGIQSIGLSFEAGISFNTLDNFMIETSGSNFVTAEIHFYL